MSSVAMIESGIARLKWLAAATRFEIALLRHGCALKAGFNPDQPRVPAGSSGGGQWIGDSTSQQTANVEITDFGAARRRRLGSKPDGHHFVHHSLYSKLPLQEETRKVFDEAKTGRLLGPRHGNSGPHVIYNEAVGDLFNGFLAERGIEPEQMTPQDAREFVDRVKRSQDPRIRDFNLRVLRQHFRFLLRYMPRNID